MGKFDVNYWPHTVIKGHAFNDFITEFTYSDTTEVVGTAGTAKATKEVETEKGKMPGTENEDSDNDSE